MSQAATKSGTYSRLTSTFTRTFIMHGNPVLEDNKEISSRRSRRLSQRSESRVSSLPKLRTPILMSLTQIPESGLKLAQVVDFFGKPWTKLEEDSRFSRFHAKFWGRGTDDDAALDSKTQSRNHSAGDVTMDDASGDTDDTDADADSDSDADDELTSGCHELDVSPNPISDEPKIWIRADYLRIYKCVESRYDLCYKRCKAQSVVLTGQPGNGACVVCIFRTPLLSLTKAKVCRWYMHYDGAVLKGNRSYGTMDLRVTFSLKTASIKWRRIFT